MPASFTAIARSACAQCTSSLCDAVLQWLSALAKSCLARYDRHASLSSSRATTFKTCPRVVTKNETPTTSSVARHALSPASSASRWLVDPGVSPAWAWAWAWTWAWTC